MPLCLLDRLRQAQAHPCHCTPSLCTALQLPLLLLTGEGEADAELLHAALGSLRSHK